MKKVNIIIADDSPEFVQGLKALLSLHEKYLVVETYKNGAELVNSTQLPNCDLILSDIQMPEKNGLQAAQEINFENQHIKLIALTMHKDDIYLSEIISAGFKGFVHKPDTAQELIATIERVLKNEFVFPNDLEL